MEIKTTHEGKAYKEAIELYAKKNGFTMERIATELLSMSRQNLGYHLRKEELDKNFKALVSERLSINLSMENENENIFSVKKEDTPPSSTNFIFSVFGKIKDIFSDNSSSEVEAQRRNNAEKQLQLQELIVDKMNEYETTIELQKNRIAELEAEILRLKENS